MADPFAGVVHMMGHPYLRYAFLAGTGIAAASGLVGYFVVLRAQVFAGDALGHVAFTGALAALAAGVDLAVGLYGACVAVALVMAALGARGKADDTVVGIIFSWVLGLGALFLAVYTRGGSGDAASGVNVLFGSIFGLSRGRAVGAAAVAAVVAVAVLAIARPLLFASIDEPVARARRVPVRALGLGFLTLVGLTAAAASQAVGALLLVGLLAAPAGAAQLLTARPYRGLALSAVIAVVSVWAGLSIAYAAASVPPSFGVLAVATACYLAAGLSRTVARSGRSASPPR
ncbi:MAG TPA: metal ABC transporter permease [Acidimicrobiales bacterium]|nr:metal ABC transporter permease [Acidimicrobiales bacterium]